MKANSLLLAPVLLFCFGCQSGSHYKGGDVSAQEVVLNKSLVSDKSGIDNSIANKQAVTDIVMPPPSAPIQKKIIKEGDIQFESSDVAETRRQIIVSLKKQGGYIEEDKETVGEYEGRRQFVLNVKIPAANFDAFVNSVSATASKIDSKNISAKDVTTQYIDTKARLDNKKLLETRYQELLKKATKISEILEIESKIEEIRSDIESTQGQLNYMDKQVAFSSLTITFYTKQPAQVETSVGFWYRVKDSLGNGFNSLQEIFFGVLSAWPFCIVLIVVYLLVKRWRNSKKASNVA